MWGKIKDGVFIPLPVNYITDDGITIMYFNTCSEDKWRNEGFKPVIEAVSQPDYTNTYEPVYEDKGDHIEIVSWTLIPRVYGLEDIISIMLGKKDDELD